MTARRRLAALAGLAVVGTLAAGCAAVRTVPLSHEALVAQVTAAEIAFAKSMSDRDHAAFLSHVADDAVFLNGGKPLRGKAAVGEFWRRFYTGATPPFSWKPDLVEVAASGGLAQSVGPVAAPGGKVVSRFYSTWRLEPDGRWRVVFDDGYNLCDCPVK